MENLSATPSHPQDPFAGCDPQPVSCRWLADEKATRSTEIIRLIVDDQRGHCGPWANDVYQRHFLREVQDFIGPSDAVLVTDAGSIKTYIQPIDATVESLNSGLASLEEALSRVELGQMEVLLGVDGCIPGDTTRLQTVVHLRGRPHVSLSNTAVKVYPTDEEASSLVGWRICKGLGHFPDQLAPARRPHTMAGTIMVLVCYDAILLKGYSRRKITDSLKIKIRQHLQNQASLEPRPVYIILATHWQGTNPKTGRWSGETFRKAADYLAEETGATVVTTMRTPRHEFALAADRFRIVGPRKEKVATLLVSDTP
jgi:hypothetical protein